MERLGGRPAGIGWLAFISLIFYGIAEPWHLLIILPSIAFNFSVGVRLASCEPHPRLLFAAIATNLALLGYFKYANFVTENIQTLTGLPLLSTDVTLPAGISFYTFTQIAFLVDSYRHQTREVNFSRYTLFVTFFPHLIAGPIIHHSEMLPQFAKGHRGMNARNISIGLSILIIGLAKKVLIADNLALMANPVFDAVYQGQTITFFESWTSALAYTFQLYFDFSAYSDMAIGLSLMFGIKMPINFSSPYKSRSIIEFWRRWHMTLSRFLLEYLYIPLGGNRHGAPRMLLALLATMLLGGLWHGAGWTFILWGGLHGGYLIINHGWRFAQDRATGPLSSIMSATTILSWPITFISICVGWVIFRAENLDTAFAILNTMSGFHGFTFPAIAELRLGTFADTFKQFGVTFSGANIVSLEDWREFGIPVIVLAATISFFAPNTQQIFARYKPALPVYANDQKNLPRSRLAWTPNFMWMVYLATLTVVCMLSLNRVSEFIYFRF
ncbi:MAG: MBOAT family protein [Rhodospirillales bacterium]|nr:MBOAT family protein [Rhodospirillales bacterium]